MFSGAPFDSFPDINGDGRHDLFDVIIAETAMREEEKKKKQNGTFDDEDGNDDGFF